MLEKLRRWLNKRALKKHAGCSDDDDDSKGFWGQPLVTLRIRQARNGRVVEAMFTKTPTAGAGPRLRDYDTIIYLVPEDATMAEAFTHVCALVAMEQ